MRPLYNLLVRSGILKAVAQTVSTTIVWLTIGGFLFDPFNFVSTGEALLFISIGMILTYTIWHWSWSFSLASDQKLKRSDSSAEAMAILINHLTEEERRTLRDRLVYSAYEDGELPSLEDAEGYNSNRYS
ncbi:MAG: hypothetical protein L0154_29975 [Chloroflexi bacterium]|nr:hypothetical protein [Chloroflexota bacterium]